MNNNIRALTISELQLIAGGSINPFPDQEPAPPSPTPIPENPDPKPDPSWGFGFGDIVINPIVIKAGGIPTPEPAKPKGFG